MTISNRGYYDNKEKNFTRAFVHPTFGANLAQDGAFSTSLNLYDGGDTAGWTPSTVQGTWNFTDTVNPFSNTNCFSIASASNGDAALFTGGAAIDATTYTALTIEVRLEAYSGSNNTILIQCLLSGTPVGSSFDVNQVINTSMLGEYQNAVVSLADNLGLDPSDTFDEVQVTITRSGGPAAAVRFDELLARGGDGDIPFNLSIDSDKIFLVSAIEFALTRNVTGTSARDPDTLLGVTLANGLVINRVELGEVVQGRNISSLSEFKAFRFRPEAWDDGASKTSLILAVNFDPPLRVDGTVGDAISISVQDDLTAFASPNGRLSAVATGGFLLV
jgi:hypothetical protein